MDDRGGLSPDPGRVGPVVDDDRPGPVYDTALRGLAQGDPVALLGLLGVPLHGAVRSVAADLVTVRREADLVAAVGDDLLCHVEYVRRPDRSLLPRLLVYRGLLMERHPGRRLTQHVVVLGGGRVVPHGPTDGFTLDLGVLYLREVDPGRLLATPSLAPLAVLGRGSEARRAEVFATALRVIAESGGDRTVELVGHASVLATVTLPVPTIKRIAKEVGMTVESIAAIYRDTPWGEYAFAQGVVEGRVEGRVEARVAMLGAILRSRFGDHPGVDEAARRLAASDDEQAAVAAALAAARPEDLLGD